MTESFPAATSAALAGALVSAALRLATPLLIAALGELVAERSGVLNIGIEGMMLGGAFAADLAGIASGSAALACAAALAAGSALAGVFALCALQRRADPIVCGTALNILALGITGSAHRLLAPADGGAPRVAEWWPGLHPFELAAGLLAVAVTAVLAHTRLGLQIRASGEGARAAHAQGIAVLRLRLGCTLVGGALAGLAGATLVLWISDSFVEGMTSGRGFIALALVLFGGYRTLRIAGGALLFGLASAVQFRLQAIGVEVSYNLLLMLPYLLTLLVLSLFSGRSRVPADLARPFEA
jgi:ABC-type uncharacterized transport system permease subunit